MTTSARRPPRGLDWRRPLAVLLVLSSTTGHLVLAVASHLRADLLAATM